MSDIVQAEMQKIPMGPPKGWTEVSAGMCNFDGAIEPGTDEALRDQPHFGRHAAWHFNGLVWWHDGKWHEQVWVYGSPRATYSAETLEELRSTVNDEHGWE